MQRKKTLLIPFLAIAFAAGAETALFDFESESERAKVPKSKMLECVKDGAVSGAWCLRFHPPTWRIGLDEWPSFNLPVAHSDWTGYDRLVVDIVNYGQDARLSAFIGGTAERVQTGLSPKSIFIPDEGFVRWTIPLKDWPETAPAGNVRRVHLFMTRPIGVDIRLDRFLLLRPGEEAPPVSREFIRAQVERTFPGRLRKMELDHPQMKHRIDAFRARLAQIEDGRSYQRMLEEMTELGNSIRHSAAMKIFRGACVAAGAEKNDAFFVGKATSMEKIRPRGGDMPSPADRLSVRLARGEYESLQLFVLPGGKDLKNVRVEVSDLDGPSNLLFFREKFSATNVKVSVVGYVQTRRVPPYTVARITPSDREKTGYRRVSGKAETGWWPDPILDYLDRTDVRGDDLQGFWLRFRAPRAQAAGVYRGEVAVSADGVEPKVIPLEVRVDGFEVPAKTPLPTAITFGPGPSSQFATPEEQVVNARLRKDPEYPGNCWKRHESRWYGFLAEYYITVDNLYHRGNNGFPKVDALKVLAGQGRLDCFNLGYWSYPGSLTEAGKEAWRRGTLGHLRRSWRRAKDVGVEKFAYLYGCDEISEKYFENIRWAVAELKKEFPGVPISTTAYDNSFGTGSALGIIDWFTPLTPKFDLEKAAEARRQGRKVWWYICCAPHEPYANMFIESPAIEGRLLMGAQTVKYRPDGFLYYQTTIWNSSRPISGPSAFTDWVARSWTTYHGDGSWICCGPDGTPLPTVRLENFRDGLEDFAYAKLLERKLAENPSAPWAEKARRLLAVPDEVSADLQNYTYSPAVLYSWREAIADLIAE